MKNWIELTRPKTLLTGLAPVFLAYGHLKFEEIPINDYLCALTIFCVIMLQIGSNLANDLYDGVRGIDNEDRLGPQRSTSSGLVSPKKLKTVTFLVFFLSLISGSAISYFCGIEIFIVGILSLIVAFAYTGGPFPLSYHALGEFLAFLFFGPVAVCGVFYIQDKQISMNLVMSSLMPGFFSAALMSLNNYRDIYSDQKTRKKTIAIYLGENKAKYLTAILIIIGTILGIAYNNNGYYFLVLPLLLSLVSTLFIFKTPHGIKLNKGLGIISVTNFAWCTSYYISTWF